jgi:hypothetical protein
MEVDEHVHNSQLLECDHECEHCRDKNACISDMKIVVGRLNDQLHVLADHLDILSERMDWLAAIIIPRPKTEVYT